MTTRDDALVAAGDRVTSLGAALAALARMTDQTVPDSVGDAMTVVAAIADTLERLGNEIAVMAAGSDDETP